MSAGHVLVARLDSAGDVLVCGPAVRAVAASAERVTMLVSRRGAEAARLLPGVTEVLDWDCPWITSPPPATRGPDIAGAVERIAAARPDAALILTSFHQSALPTALLLRLAGVGRIAAVSTDHPGSLLDVRVPEPPDAPEPERMLAVARAAGFALPAGDDGRLRVTAGAARGRPPAGRAYVVVHPGADAPSRCYPATAWREVVARLTAADATVVITGSAGERALAEDVAAGAAPPGRVLNLAGRTELADLARLLAGAAAAAVGNTGPAHLAAAVGTPVVSLFAPVVPVSRWAPYTADRVVLGDQDAPCAGSRARICPVPGHPCLASVPPAEVVAALDLLAAGAVVPA